MKIILVVLALIAAVLARGGCSGKDFDYLLLVEQWPGAENSPIDHFTIHGLWPSRLQSSSYPCDCTSDRFSMSKMSPIMDRMNSYWPTLFSTASYFWSHEYEKHGTCAGLQVEGMDNQIGYFKGTLDLRDQYDATVALKKIGVVPSNTIGYNSTIIKDGFKQMYGQAPMLQCKSKALPTTQSGENKHHHKTQHNYVQQLVQLGVCLDMNKNIMECSKYTSGTFERCRSSEPIYIPYIAQ
eukprot:TRINITY_DN2247_c0_g1_i1.p1 TRINITY_DN2247_c0_g1~~TRINITY_DN2247_c0_g1_i1.p1  ORF type:complete len:251 (+),score=39.70 TRINITY_DN2247_c0_g1_i1:37-753(+)